MTTFNEIFKSKFLETTASFSITDSLIALLAAFLIGMFIYMIYQKTFAGVMYSRSFNISLVGLSLLTTFVILAVTSNVVLSLGMVGALSIVRFRTAIKDPLDLVFLFWAIGVGIVCGAGYIVLAIVASVIVGLLLVFFASRNIADIPYILMVNCEGKEAAESVVQSVKTGFKKYQMKSKTVSSGDKMELIYEVRLNNDNTDIVNAISESKGVTNAVLVSYNGDYSS